MQKLNSVVGVCLLADTGGQGATRRICGTRVAGTTNNTRRDDKVVAMKNHHLLSHRQNFFFVYFGEERICIYLFFCFCFWLRRFGDRIAAFGWDWRWILNLCVFVWWVCLCCVVCGVVGCCVVDFIATVYLGKLEFRQSKLGLLAPPTRCLCFRGVVWCNFPYAIFHFRIFCVVKGPFALGDGMCRCI